MLLRCFDMLPATKNDGRNSAKSYSTLIGHQQTVSNRIVNKYQHLQYK